MSENKSASRYAKSLIDLSIEQNALEEIRNDMVLIEQVIAESSELETILENPVIPLDKKYSILEAIFNKNVHAITKSYLKLVVSKGRAAILFDTAKAFTRQYNVIKGIVTAEVSTATALTDANKAEIVAIVKREMGAKEVLIKEKLNEKLIGGFILKVGDKQFDASIAGSLNKLKKELSHGVV
jgi:F-type H+-transporting ATPase subunit delta